MSLLLKALKQAEAGEPGTSNRSRPGDRRAPELDLEPLAPPGSQPRGWVEPPGLLFGSSGLSPAPPPSAPRFRLPRLSLVPATALLALLIALGYGIYLYFALKPPAPLPAVQAPAPASPLSMTAPSLPEETDLVVAAPLPQPADTGPAASMPEVAARPPLTLESATRRAPAPRAASPRAALADASPAPALPVFQPDSPSLLLNRAYEAFQRGALAEAQQLYTQAAALTRSVDALLGLATIASVQNRDTDALRLYREVLELDPRHPLAQAALLDLLSHADAQAAESRLKILIERAPKPSLYQMLGNLYADQQRWGEAQAAYFEAFRGAPGNADYAFNLAVSLDHLRQYPAARTYYEKALALGGAHRFDRTLAEARLRELQALR